MIFCSPKYPPSSFPESLPEYLQKQQQQSSAAVFLERLPIDADDALIDEVSAVITRSFAGNHKTTGEAMFDWAIGPDFPRDDPACEAKRIEWLGFYMKWCLLMSLEYGLVLIARERDRTGKVLGAVCSYPPGNADKALTFGWHMIKIGYRMRRGPSEVLGKEPNKRVETTGVVMNQLHNPAEAASTASNPSGTPPWYIHILATDIAAQGKGCGSALLRCIHYLADRDAADTMLEYSGTRKEGYYCGKHGYENFGEKVTLPDPLACSGTAAIRGYRQPRLPL